MARYDSESQRQKSLKRWGDPTIRFWARVEKSDGCWIWKGCTGKTSPYGLVRWKGKQTTAHKAAFEMSGGVVLPGQVVRHECDTPLCVNPAHLKAGTQLENIHDCISKGRAARGDALKHSPQKGELNHAAKLSDVGVQQIREQFAKGASQVSLAKLFGTTTSNVHMIVRFKSRAANTSSISG